MTDEFNPKRVAENLSKKQTEILRTFDRVGEAELNTRDLTRATGYGNALVFYHASQLTQRDLIKKTGVDESVNTPNPPNVYRITDQGEGVIEAIRRQDQNRAVEVAADELGLDDLKAHVERLQEENENLWDRVTELEETVEKHEQFIEQVITMSNGDPA